MSGTRAFSVYLVSLVFRSVDLLKGIQMRAYLAIPILALLVGCSPCGTDQYLFKSENVKAACGGGAEVAVKDQTGKIAGYCKKEGPSTVMCMQKDFCSGGTWKIDQAGANCTPRGAALRACRHSEFGIESWGQTETYGLSSDWKGPGYDQQRYCTDVKNAFLAERHISAPFESKVVDTHEDSNSGRYKYRCALEFKWLPVYFEKTDARCGTY